MLENLKVRPGSPKPLGATCYKTGVNFSIFSEHATSIELLIFDCEDDPKPFMTVALDPKVNNTFHFWHVFVEGLKPGYFYAFRADGPYDPKNGHRFNKSKVLIDPYSRGISDAVWRKEDACNESNNLATSLRSVIIDSSNYDWEGDKPLNRPMNEAIIYEMHVGGFTKSPTSGCKHPGKFQGVIEKIPYLKKLGVNTIELLPVFDFDTTESVNKKLQLSKNFWGYGTIGYFAPEGSYCLSPAEGTHLRDFRDMIKALHKAGLEVILDVVFGYTPEGNENGPTICFKGLDNSVYYQLPPDHKENYYNYSGCGNTLNCNHPIVSKFVIDCLEFWVKEMHVDGFRFDEGSILTRNEYGQPTKYPTVLWNIELSEVLENTKMIAEAWDAAGLYQVGQFPGYRWAEWNGRFRDNLRQFIKGEGGLAGAVAARICGSADLYESSGRLPSNSINFVTCHDGFTLNDLVSYNQKHNEANGENNEDGCNDNCSWNCGAEGETDDPEVENLRVKQIKNYATMLFLSRGVPMILAGDEIRRTQKGNNNPYCQDNEISWFDWGLAEKNKDMLRFYQELIKFRKSHPVFSKNAFYNTEVKDLDDPEIVFHGCKLYSPGWYDPETRVLSFTIKEEETLSYIHVMMNMHWEDQEFEIPAAQNGAWRKVIDTAEKSPSDITNNLGNSLNSARKIWVKNHSIVVLIAQ